MQNVHPQHLVRLVKPYLIMIKIPVLLLLFLILTCTLTAQSCSVSKTNAFSRRLFPGNITADNQPEGKPEKPRFMYEVYLQTTCSKPPQIAAAWIDGVHYTATATRLSDNKVVAGIYQNKGDTAFIQKVANQEADTTVKTPVTYRYKAAGKILLQLTLNSKTIWQLTPPIQLLEADVMY